MEQIKRLTNKIIKIVSNAKGLVEPKKNPKKTDNDNNSYIDFIQEDESDLKTIPSISDENDIDDTLYNKNYQIDDLNEENENEEENIKQKENKNNKKEFNKKKDNKEIKQRKNISNSSYDITSNSLNTILEDESFSSYSNSISNSKSNKNSKSNSNSESSNSNTKN